MRKVKAIIEQASDGNFSVFMDAEDMDYLVTGTGKTEEEAIQCFKDGYEDTKRYYAEEGKTFEEVEFVFVKDMDTRRCDRCALSKQCHDYDGADGEKFICFDLFSDMAINCRFERRQSEQKLL
jgi:predicted RNase H-like HicB family nuclease